MNPDATYFDSTGEHQPAAAPHGGAKAVTLEQVHRQNEQIITRLEAIGTQLAGVVEFVDVLKNVGAQAAHGNGMQAMMLRNMVPGIELLGGK